MGLAMTDKVQECSNRAQIFISNLEELEDPD